MLFAAKLGVCQTLRWEPSREENNTIGSDSQTNRFALSGDGVAARHAVIRMTDSGWQLESEGAAETRLNDQRVTRSPVSPDDVIGIGAHRILIKVKAISWMWVLPSAF